jgi:hypothetical protein
MKDLIKKYEDKHNKLDKEYDDLVVLKEDDALRPFQLDRMEYLMCQITILIDVIEDLKTLSPPKFSNPERLILQRLVKDEIATPRKKLGTSKMNTLYSLEGKLKK